MNGLSDKEVVNSRDKYGTNEIIVGKKESFFSLLMESLGDPIIKILLLALGIKLVFLMADFDWYETIGIVIAIILASLISTISEYGSSRAFDRLMNEASKINCKVKRNGKICEVLVDDIVVGDILVLSSGDKIGADGVIIDGSVDVDESTINGEADAVKRGVRDTLYRGCVVYHGRAMLRVDKVGNNTYYGRMVQELGGASDNSPLKDRLNGLAVTISKIGYVGAILVSVSYLFERIVINNNFDIDLIINTLTDFSLMFAYFLHALTLSVTVIVVSVPEGLPMLVTLVLSSNMRRMLKDNVLVRKMVGIETAGSLNILFTDKTGTLTRGKLEVVSFMLGNLNLYSNINEVGDRYRDVFVKSLIYNNESYYDSEEGKIIGGNVTDRAILDYVKVKRSDKVDIVNRVYFDSNRKYSSVSVIDSGKSYTYIKGASEVILPRCKYYLNEDGFRQLILNKDAIISDIDDIASRGIRVLCVAYIDNGKYILVGFILIKDDIRDEAVEGIRLIKNAGIDIVMVTGDNRGTAVNIAREVGIISDSSDLILSSDELRSYSDYDVGKILPRLKVLYRAMPDDKSRLVNIAKNLDLVVGMTGDGVNDAIALRRADVGFSMGSGTEVSKEASDIVILDDNILSIEKAILYGRTIFKSIRKFIIFQLTVNICAVSISVIGPFIGIQAPVTVIQMLWINMVMDTLAGLAFSCEPALDEYMEELPKRRNEAIINKYMFNEIGVMGIYSSFICLFFLKSSFIRGLFRYSSSDKYLLTAFFGLFIFISIFNCFNARTYRLNILHDIFKNRMFLGIIFLVVLVQIIMIYYGGNIFRTSGLTLTEFVVMIIISLSVIPVDFLRKVILKRRGFDVKI